MDKLLNWLLEKIFPRARFGPKASILKFELESAVGFAKSIEAELQAMKESQKKEYVSRMRLQETAERLLGIVVWKILGWEQEKKIPSTKDIAQIQRFLEIVATDSSKKEVAAALAGFIEENFINRARNEFLPIVQEIGFDQPSVNWILERVEKFKQEIEMNDATLVKSIDWKEKAEYRLLTTLRYCVMHKAAGWNVTISGLCHDRKSLAVLIGEEESSGRHGDPMEGELANDPEAMKVVKTLIAFIDSKINYLESKELAGSLATNSHGEFLKGCVDNFFNLSPAERQKVEASPVFMIKGKDLALLKNGQVQALLEPTRRLIGKTISHIIDLSNAPIRQIDKINNQRSLLFKMQTNVLKDKSLYFDGIQAILNHISREFFSQKT